MSAQPPFLPPHCADEPLYIGTTDPDLAQAVYWSLNPPSAIIRLK